MKCSNGTEFSKWSSRLAFSTIGYTMPPLTIVLSKTSLIQQQLNSLTHMTITVSDEDKNTQQEPSPEYFKALTSILSMTYRNLKELQFRSLCLNNESMNLVWKIKVQRITFEACRFAPDTLFEKACRFFSSYEKSSGGFLGFTVRALGHSVDCFFSYEKPIQSFNYHGPLCNLLLMIPDKVPDNLQHHKISSIVVQGPDLNPRFLESAAPHISSLESVFSHKSLKFINLVLHNMIYERFWLGHYDNKFRSLHIKDCCCLEFNNVGTGLIRFSEDLSVAEEPINMNDDPTLSLPLAIYISSSSNDSLHWKKPICSVYYLEFIRFQAPRRFKSISLFDICLTSNQLKVLFNQDLEAFLLANCSHFDFPNQIVNIFCSLYYKKLDGMSLRHLLQGDHSTKLPLPWIDTSNTLLSYPPCLPNVLIITLPQVENVIFPLQFVSTLVVRSSITTDFPWHDRSCDSSDFQKSLDSIIKRLAGNLEILILENLPLLSLSSIKPFLQLEPTTLFLDNCVFGYNESGFWGLYGFKTLKHLRVWQKDASTLVLHLPPNLTSLEIDCFKPDPKGSDSHSRSITIRDEHSNLQMIFSGLRCPLLKNM
jgi:hypothetical protein